MRSSIDLAARLGLVLALVLVAACDDAAAPTKRHEAMTPPPEREAPEGALAGIAIRSTPSPALVFFDGRFAGQTSTLGPIEIVDAVGRHQIRISEAGRLDAVHDVELAAGTIVDFAAELVGARGPWKTPAEIRLSVGQPVRCLLRGDDPVLYVIDEEFVPRRMLVVTSGAPKFRVFGPEGKEVPVSALKTRPAGTPGNKFYEYAGKTPGRYRIEVRGNKARAAWRFVQALPPLAETDVPAMKGRRVPPAPPIK